MLSKRMMKKTRLPTKRISDPTVRWFNASIGPNKKVDKFMNGPIVMQATIRKGALYKDSSVSEGVNKSITRFSAKK